MDSFTTENGIFFYSTWFFLISGFVKQLGSFSWE